MAADLELASSVVDPSAAIIEGPPLLESKFSAPAAPRFMVTRHRLLERLSRCVRDPVTLVTGPAGCGKTQLVASWTNAGSEADVVVWITLEGRDSRPAALWTYVVEGMRRAGLKLFPAEPHPVPTGPIDHAFLVRLAAELADQPRPVILVLDDVSTLNDHRWADDLDFVLRHASRRLRLLLVGRWDPPLALYRYRLAGTLGEIRGDELAFTAAEAAELLALHGLALPAPTLMSLVQHTEGWAAGLRLFAMALEGRDDAESFVATIAGDDANIAEYFLGEVLRSQPPQVREFLLKTSIVEAVTPELAELLTGHPGAGRTLATLQHENAFVQLVPGHPVTYRYHRLFAELLRAELAYDDADQKRRLHRRAAGWFVAEGRVPEAVGHAVAAGDWEAAAGIVIEDFAVGRLVIGGQADRLGAHFRYLPDDVGDPRCAIVASALALAGGNPVRSAKQLARAEELVADAPPSHALALASALLGALLPGTGQDAPKALRSATVARSLLAGAPADRLAVHPELRALVLAATGTAQSWVGATDAAVVTLAEAAEAADAVGCESPRLDSLRHLALIEAHRGQLRHATVLAKEAIDLARRSAPALDTVAAEVAQAWVAMERYDMEAAGRHLRVAEPRCDGRADGSTVAGFAVVKSRLMRARRDLHGALRILRDAGEAAGRPAPPAWLAREITLDRARLLTATGQPDDACATVGGLTENDRPDAAVVLAEVRLATGDRRGAWQIVTPVIESTDATVPVLIDAWLIKARLAVQDGNLQGTRDALRRVLRLADAESHRRSIHETEVRVRRILRDDAELAGQYRTLGHRSHEPDSPARGSRGSPVEPVIVDALSVRETEVLRYLAAMMPTEEIAATMYVSVNTVKTHIRSILRKLSASRRNEAVRRARMLGFI